MKPIEPPMPDLSTPVVHKNPNSPIEVSIKIFLAIAGIILVVLGGIYAYTLLMENQIRPSEYESFKYLPAAKTPTNTLVPSPASDTDMANWKTYRDEKLGYEVKYPANFYYYEISPASISSSEVIAFQESNKWQGSYEWPRIEFETFNSGNLSLAVWLAKNWLLEDIDVGSLVSNKNNLDKILSEREERVINSYNAVKLSLSEETYDIFIQNRTNKVVKVTCIMYFEDISRVCDQILSTFRFLENDKLKAVCTQEAKQCLDGSYVSRQGPNCEFAPCPVNE